MATKESESKIDSVFKNYASKDNGALISLGKNIKLNRIDNSNGQGPS
jgi:hypothetical protein